MAASSLCCRIPFTLVISLATAFVGGSRVMAEEGFGLGNGLIGIQLVASGQAESLATPRLRPAAGKVLARQAVPARERVDLSRQSEFFQMSRVAMPLLVADLEPRIGSGVIPMSGRSVGARNFR